GDVARCRCTKRHLCARRQILEEDAAIVCPHVTHAEDASAVGGREAVETGPGAVVARSEHAARTNVEKPASAHFTTTDFHANSTAARAPRQDDDPSHTL